MTPSMRSSGGAILLLLSIAVAACGAHPRTGKGFRSRAEELLSKGDLAGARASVHEALKRRPRDAEAHVVAARVERAAGRPGQAVVLLLRAVELAPERSEIRPLAGELLLERGRALAALGRDSGASRDFARAGELAPALAPAIALLQKSAPAAAAGGAEDSTTLETEVRELSTRDHDAATR